MALWRRGRLAAGDTVYNLSPLFRGPALLTAMLPALLGGLTLILPSRFDPSGVLDELSNGRVTFFHANPYHFAALASADAPDCYLGHIRHCISSGNKLPRSVAERFRHQYALAIHERYGTLEAGGIARDGRLLPGVDLRLEDENGQALSGASVIGEIVVRTPWMVSEYEGLPERTREAFPNGWFRTGDQGRLLPDGRLEIVRRIKASVRRDGRLIYADDIKDILIAHRAVRAAMVVRDRNAGAGGSFIAYVLVKVAVEAQQLLEYCRGRIEYGDVLHAVEIRSELPRTWKTLTAEADTSYPHWGHI